MNKKISLIVSIIIGIIIGAFGYNLVTKNSQAGTSINTTQGNSTYSSSAYGITFTYPNTYILTEKDTGTAQQKRHTITLIAKADAVPMNAQGTSTPGEAPTAITFDIFQNSNKLSVSDWVKNTNESNFKLGDGFVSPVSIAGVPAVTYSWDGLYKGNSIVFAHKDNIVMTSMTYLTFQDDIWKDFAGVIKTLKLQ